ncbi:bifunctional adenosylcobinamide kinase/adenosylcobinamide-phosphate guanylyltransferase [Rhodococcus sp. NPDC058521]|uniref:bifunctional adenosylcobinamide kinase/adenosylcobinamide-phosphate guanylyltransferase n=1 Tax=Rhodococcus sp. NPDC058521 TaxID=3346536 RepID=UPI00364CF262
MVTSDTVPDTERADHGVRTLVLGGARSGKSAHAESLAGGVPDSVAVRYLATARRHPDDSDWEERIDGHRRRRPIHWTVVETAHRSGLVDELGRTDWPVTLVDDLGTWLTDTIDSAHAWDRPRGTIAVDVDSLVDRVRTYPRDLVIVSPEVGLAVVPESRSGRLFRDEIGALNARLANECDRVVLVVAGLPLVLKDSRP